MSENEKFARMIVALETIADALAPKPVVETQIHKALGYDFEYRLCTSCGLIVVHEVTDDYCHCTMCGKLSAVD